MAGQKIQLGLIWSGDHGQAAVNRQQFQELSKMLTSFLIRVYDFNRDGRVCLLRDYAQGQVDVVLKNSYGRGNEADVELWLELHRIPFLGSEARATLTGTSKLLSKKLFKRHGIPLAKDIFVDRRRWRMNHDRMVHMVRLAVGFPCIIKDVAGTDSRGIYLARNTEECKKNLARAMQLHQAVIVEEYIEGVYETTCFVVGNGKATHAYAPVGLRGSGGGIVSGQQKDRMVFDMEVPAVLPLKVRNRIKQISVRAHRILKCRDFSRADVLVKGNRLYLLEVDVHPGFRKKSATTQSVEYAGENLNELFLAWCKKYV